MYTLKYKTANTKPVRWIKITGTSYKSRKAAMRKAQDSANFFGTSYKVYKEGKLVATVNPK